MMLPETKIARNIRSKAAMKRDSEACVLRQGTPTAWKNKKWDSYIPYWTIKIPSQYQI